MSVTNTTTIDAATVRDGWAVLSIHHFEFWEPVDLRLEELREKVATYEAFVLSPRFQSTYYRLPVRIELVSGTEPPDEVVAFCDAHAVALLGPVATS